MFSAYLWPLAVANVCTLKTHLTMDGYMRTIQTFGVLWECVGTQIEALHIFCPFCLRPKSNPFRCSFKISAWYKSEVIVVGGRADSYKSVQQGLHCLDHGRTDVCTVLARHTSPTLVVRNCPRPTTRQIQKQNTSRHLSPTNYILLSRVQSPLLCLLEMLPTTNLSQLTKSSHSLRPND